jgi:integrase
MDDAEAKMRFEERLKIYIADKKINPYNKQLLKRFLRDCDLDKFTRSVGHKRRLRYLDFWKNMDYWFKHKPFNRITAADFEQWYLDTKSDKIRRKDGKVYSENSKATYRIVLKTVWKWFKGGGDVVPKEVKNFRTGWEKKEPETITKSEAEKLANSFKDFKYKFAVLFLFDSGFRIDEFLTMKHRNLTVASKGDGSEYYLAKCEVSKTKPRKISVSLYPRIYGQFLQEYH